MRWVGATIVLAALGGAASGCGSSVFACASDEQCQGAEAGLCQPEGYCSFPDESCPSGQRFGDAAPSGVANACVDQGDASTGASTGPMPSSEGSEPPPPDPDDGPIASTTLTTDEGSTTAAVADDTSTGSEPTGTGAEDTSTGEAAACTTSLVDPFDGTELSVPWGTFNRPGTALWVADGQLWFEIGANVDWIVAGALIEVESIAGGWARARVTEPDDSGLLIAGGVVVANEICHLQMFIDPGGVAATIWNNETLSTTELGYVPLPGLPLWLQVRLDDDRRAYFEWSPDAITWNELTSGTFEECGDLGAAVVAGINVGGQLQPMQIGTRSFDEFQMCLP